MSTPAAPIRPAAGQESVWDYPRPPRIEQIDARVRIRLGGAVIVDTTDVVRVLETSHPPVYYLPLSDFAAGSVVPAVGSSFCEFKGSARYFSLVSGGATAERAAWNYPSPEPGYELLRDRMAVYAGQVDDASVDGEVVTPQPGGFYGGWVTSTIVGPFKGEPGTSGW